MRITITRTGGLVAAPGLRVQATAVLTSHGGEVTARGNYRRTVTEEESNRLTDAAEQVCVQFSARSAGSPRGGSARPDAFRFRFDIDTGGEVVSVADVDLPASAAMRVLSDWAEEESTRIVLQEPSEERP